METGLLLPVASQDVEPQADLANHAEALQGSVPIAPAPEPAQPAYLARIATLPSALPEPRQPSEPIARPDPARLDQIEHALTILASVVARLAKEAQQSRLHLRSTELDPSLQEERRVQRELVRSMQARLDFIEERFEREQQARLEPPPPGPDITQSLVAIRDSLAALAQRKSRNRYIPAMEREAELERIRQYSVAARQRIRRLDVMLEEQVRILNLDPSLNSLGLKKRGGGHLITLIEIRVFAVGFLFASLCAFAAGYWTAHFR